MSNAHPSANKQQALFSIHDVMPETLEHVGRLARMLLERALLPATLLIVPGRNWTDADLEQLRLWQREGFALAGHGWLHRSTERKNLYHWLHSKLLSREAAEHLSRPAGEIAGLIRRCHAWFAEHKFPAPELYVPPAWANGALKRGELERLPFRLYETLSGIYDRKTRRFRRLPVIGYEADSALFAGLVRASNALNRAGARQLRRPLRVALHPYDAQLRLAGQLDALTAARYEPVEYAAALPAAVRGKIGALKDAK